MQYKIIFFIYKVTRNQNYLQLVFSVHIPVKVCFDKYQYNTHRKMFILENETQMKV